MRNTPVLSPSSAAPVPVVPGAGERAVVVGRMLATASEGFMSALRVPVRTSADLVKAAGVNKDIASRFLIALSKRDPLAVVYYMPGVESLRRLSRGAKLRTGDLAALRAFERAIGAYEEFLQDDLGGRHALDAMASAWLPEARERFESASRQMAYRAAANLRGIESEAVINATIVHPGVDPDRYDAVMIQGIVGVQRLRPAIPLMLATFDHRDDTAGRPTLSLDGIPIRADGTPEEFLPRFGRGDPPALRVLRAGTSSFYQLVDEKLGAGTASDLFFGQFTQGLFRRWARMPGDIAATMEAVEIPSQRLVFDVLLDPEVWPGLEPELMLYNTCVRGAALPYDHTRDADRMDLLDTMRLVGKGIDFCRVAEVPRYLELLLWTCEKRGWDPGRFRVYRCDSRYPIAGVQYAMAFHLDQKPTGL